MLLGLIKKYADLTPTQTIEHLRHDLGNSSFHKVMMATCGPTKYYLKAEAFLAFIDKKKLAREGVAAPTVRLDINWSGWLVLDAMGSGDLSGDAAKLALAKAYFELEPEDQQVVIMILDKTFRVGITVDTVNKAVPDTFRPVKLMLAHKVLDRVAKGKMDWAAGWLATVKYDGFRGAFELSTGRTLSREGNSFPIADELRNAQGILSQALRQVYSLNYYPCLDGELFKGSWKETAEARAIGYDQYIIFNMMEPDGIYGGTSEEFDVEEFFQTCKTLIDVHGLNKWLQVTEYREVRSLEEMEDYNDEVVQRGLEGLVLTRKVRPSEGKRSYHWLKRKQGDAGSDRDPEDLPIVEVGFGVARSKNAGKVVTLFVERNGVKSGAAGMRQELIDLCTQLHADGFLKGMMTEVAYHELTPDGCLRHARVKALRYDKGANN